MDTYKEGSTARPCMHHHAMLHTHTQINLWGTVKELREVGEALALTRPQTDSIMRVLEIFRIS